MSDNPQNDQKKPLTLSRKIDFKDLISGDRIQQSKGRSKTVIVEVKRTRTPIDKSTEIPSKGLSSESGMRASKPSFYQPPENVLPTPPSPSSKPSLSPSNNLTHQEKEARLKALQEASKFVEEKAAQLGESSRRSAELRQLQEEQLEKERVLNEEIEASSHSQPLEESLQENAYRKEASKESLEEGPEDARRVIAPVKRLEPRRLGKLTVTQALSNEDGEEARRTRSLSSLRRAREKERLKAQRQDLNAEKRVREVIIPETITVQELANRMAEKSSEVIKCFMKMGMLVTITQSIDADTAQLAAEEFGHKVKRVSEADVEDILIEEKDSSDSLKPRAPIVTIMGHVDHGKTSLLDALRTTDVVSTEAGGITQHIGAYQVTLKSGQKITFIDTPGHAAFTAMRSRGANVTDIVVLVVAADDGVKDQTIEAIHHAKAAQVPIIVAINKIDKPDADPLRIRQALMQYGVFVEEMGGDILSVEVSAQKKLNLEKLEEIILLQAEIMDLKANPNRLAVGTVIESRIEKGRGPVATTLIQKGTLKIGDFFVAGSQSGRVRALVNDHGKALKEAGPSIPVEIIGFEGLPEAGDPLFVVAQESKAREIAVYRQRNQREKQAALFSKNRMENLFSQKEGPKEVAVLIKGDVQGSVEAITTSLQKLSTDEVSVKVLHSGVGGINETDVSLAKASNALIIGFNVRANTQAREAAQKENIEIRYYSIIYDVMNDVKAALSGLLSPTLKENFIGRAEIRQVFKITGIGNVAGCYVTEGIVKRGSKVRLLRDNIVIHEGSLKTLKRMKEEVKEVKQSFECGMAFENYEDIRIGDIIECSEIESIKRTL